MPIGDMVTGQASVAGGGSSYLEVKPTGTEEWVIHNIYCPDGIALILRLWDGTLTTDWRSAPGPFNNLALHVNATRWLRIVHNDAARQVLGYEGIKSHI